MENKSIQPGQTAESKERKKYARVMNLIPTRDQEYTDPQKKYAHNDLYPSAIVEVVEIGDDDRVLLRDGTGEFWVPKKNLEML